MKSSSGTKSNGTKNNDTSDQAAVLNTVRYLTPATNNPIAEDCTASAVKQLKGFLSDRLPVISEKYKVHRLIGTGGMGSVYEAEILHPIRKTVAIKLIKSGFDDHDTLARFDAERKALEMMDHPNIAKILDAGTTNNDTPYLAMEFVNGIPITTFCQQNKLTYANRLNLFMQVCSAVQHAHQKGIIHRDLKPANILVETVDGVAIPKVIDFGLVKSFLKISGDHKTNITQQGEIVGTPAYMAPEQTNPDCKDVDTRADVYALGAILYELLTETTPFSLTELAKLSAFEQMRLVREVEPQKPSDRLLTLEIENSALKKAIRKDQYRKLKGDLDWIVSKTLEKDRNRRYDSVANFAEDIRRHTRNEAISARPPAKSYKIAKFIQRNRALVLTLFFCTVASFAGIIGTTVGLLRALKAEEMANLERDTARKSQLAEQHERKNAELQAEEAKKAKELAILRLEKAKDNEKKTSSTINFFKKYILNSARPKGVNGGLGINVTLKEAILFAEPKIAEEFKEDRATECTIREALGNTYRDLGEYDLAIKQLNIVEDLSEKIYGNNSAEYASIKMNLGILYYQARHLEKAIDNMKKAIEIRRVLYKDDHIITIESENNLASVYKICKRYNEAYEIFKRHADCLKSDENRRLSYSISLYNKAVTGRSLGKTREHLSEMIESINLHSSIAGENNALSTVMKYGLGLAYNDLGENEKALDYFKSCYEQRLKIFGQNHQKTLEVTNDLGRVAISLNQFSEARTATRASVLSYMNRDQQSIDNSYLENQIPIFSNYSVIELTFGKYHDIINTTKYILNQQSFQNEKYSFHSFKIYSVLATAYMNLSQTARAVDIFEKMKGLESQFPSKYSPMRLDFIHQQLGIGYAKLSRDEDAIAALKSGIRDFENSFQIESGISLSDLYFKMKKDTEAESLLLKMWGKLDNQSNANDEANDENNGLKKKIRDKLTVYYSKKRMVKQHKQWSGVKVKNEILPDPISHHP